MFRDIHLGQMLGERYRVEALIGRGGMSTVYRGLDVQLERPVAIKVFSSDGDDDQRWESEVRLLSQLRHPNLVTLHDAHLEPAGSTDPSYLVMELVPGRDLQAHLADVGPSAALASLIIEQIGEALESVHRAGIVHRDLKPGNILLEASALPPLFLRAKLADFGIAHLLGADRVTQTGTLVDRGLHQPRTGRGADGDVRLGRLRTRPRRDRDPRRRACLCGRFRRVPAGAPDARPGPA
jgi:serine/threonine protein kinase